MKKMLFAVAIAFAAAFAQAGSVKWTTVSMYGDNDAKVTSTAMGYVYLLTAEQFSSIDVWETFGGGVKDGTFAGAYNPEGKKSSASKVSVYAPDGDATPDTTYYAAMIVTIGTGTDMKYYAEKLSVVTGNDGEGEGIFGVDVLNTAATAKAAWKPAVDVPEPTSGLLLLVGGALLALRRKQK